MRVSSFSCLLHELWGLLNVIRKWVAITAATGSRKSMASNEIAKDWDLLLQRWRDILGPSRCYGIHNRLARHLVIWSLGCRNMETRKENRTGNEVTCMVDKLFVHGDAINLTSGVCDISWSNRNSSLQLEVHSNIHSCGYRGQYGCPRLRCQSLIGRGSRSCLYFTEPIGSHA